MARMSIDDKFLRDPRVAKLALALGYSKFEVRGRLLEVYAICYDRESAAIGSDEIDLAVDLPGFATAMIACGLATKQRSDVRVSGAAERIEYLQNKKRAGKIGGANSGSSRRELSKHVANHAGNHDVEIDEAARNPPDPVPDSVPDPSPDPVPERKRGRARGKRGAVASPDELRVAMAILGRLGEHAGIAFSGATEHVRLITCRLRDGLTEAELRAVVAYCADEWKGDAKMHRHLRPEVLFGPVSIHRYLDPARARYGDLIAQHTPQLTLVPGGAR